MAIFLYFSKIYHFSHALWWKVMSVNDVEASRTLGLLWPWLTLEFSAIFSVIDLGAFVCKYAHWKKSIILLSSDNEHQSHVPDDFATSHLPLNIFINVNIINIWKKISVKHLNQGLTNIYIKGELVNIFPVKLFTKRSSRTWFANLCSESFIIILLLLLFFFRKILLNVFQGAHYFKGLSEKVIALEGDRHFVHDCCDA